MGIILNYSKDVKNVITRTFMICKKYKQPVTISKKKGVIVKALLSFQDDLVLFVFAVFALCILRVDYIIMFDIYIKIVFQGAYIEMFGNIV